MPTWVEPVKAIMSTSMWRPSAWPAVSPKPGSTCSTPSGTAGFGRQFGDAQRGERRLLGGLQDDGVAGGECRAQLPGGHHQRIVPRHHGGHHADGLAGDEGDRVRAIGRDLVIDSCRRLRAYHWMAWIEPGMSPPAEAEMGFPMSRVSSSASSSVCLSDELGELQHHLLALARMAGATRALLEDRAGRRHGAVHVLRVAFRDLGQHPAVDRRDAVEGPARGRRPRTCR